ncbi:unnamed protein product [Leuciscus chuanchicus]
MSTHCSAAHNWTEEAVLSSAELGAGQRHPAIIPSRGKLLRTGVPLISVSTQCSVLHDVILSVGGLVYLINVTYSDSTSHIIYRRYSKFFDLQSSQDISANNSICFGSIMEGPRRSHPTLQGVLGSPWALLHIYSLMRLLVVSVMSQRLQCLTREEVVVSQVCGKYSGRAPVVYYAQVFILSKKSLDLRMIQNMNPSDTGGSPIRALANGGSFNLDLGMRRQPGPARKSKMGVYT